MQILSHIIDPRIPLIPHIKTHVKFASFKPAQYRPAVGIWLLKLFSEKCVCVCYLFVFSRPHEQTICGKVAHIREIKAK